MSAPPPPTPTFLQPRAQAGLVILLLGVGIAIALVPFLVGLLGALVLYVLGKPLHARLAGILAPQRAAVAVLVAIVAFVLVPAGLVLGLVVEQAPQAVRSVQETAILDRLGQLRVGAVDIGAELSRASRNLAGWLTSQAFDVVGVATRSVINLVIALVGVYYLMTGADRAWAAVVAYLPFSEGAAERLRERFYSVTQATFYGTVLTAVVQGALIGIGFRVAGLPSPVFWAVIAAFASILPLVGGALVWLPATVVLLAEGDTAHALFLGLWGGLLVSNIDNLIRPLVFRRISNLHPLTTLVGAFAGLRYFGLLGVLVGPLAITYFFELLRIFDEEYAVVASVRRASQAIRMSGATPMPPDLPDP